jgi:serine/threonine-protein kinase
MGGTNKLAGRYEVMSLLGSGGMGSVYLAKDLELDELVALKTLSKDVIDVPGAMERFRREVKLARKVTHKNVARTYDIGEHEGLRFLTMEYIEGESLTARVQKHQGLHVPDALAIARAIGDGLEAAHAAGVVHRDLKPDNVILGKDGRVLITDFGIARAFTEGAANLTGGKPLGTPAYMAPEQVEGKAADHRADIYALGEILYEMLTGAAPFRGDSIFAIAAARLMQPPPNPCALRVTIPKALGAVVEKAMARAPGDRYADVASMMQALATLPAPSSFPVPPPAMALDATQALPHPISITPASAASSPALVGAKILAVIPFSTIGSKDDEYLASALSESLVDTLSMNPLLRVPSLAAVRVQYNNGEDPRALGERMGAHVVASGSVARDGEQLRVSARLVGVHDGFQIWARRLIAPASDILRLADETAEAIANGLALEKKTVSRDLPEDPAVLDMYLRARHLLRDPAKITSVAVPLLNDAITRAPEEPALHALMARASLQAFNFDSNPETANAAGERARLAATRALQLAPDMAAAHYALAEIERSNGNVIGAIEAYKKAQAADPRIAETHWSLGSLRARAGDPPGGLRMLARAELLDPTMPFVKFEQLYIRELAGEPEAADEAFSAPAPLDARHFGYWITRSEILTWRNDAEASKRALAIPQPEGPRPPASFVLETIVNGRLEEKHRDMLEAQARVGAGSVSRTVFFRKIMAGLYMAANDPERAMHCIAEADGAGLADILWLRRCAVLAPLRSRADFVEIEARVATRADAILAAIKRA